MWSSYCGTAETNPTRNHKVARSIPGFSQWLKDPALPWAMVGPRCGLDLVLLWLWHRPAAVAPIRPLAWEPPYATGSALKKTKSQKKKKKKKDTCTPMFIVALFTMAKMRKPLKCPSTDDWIKKMWPAIMEKIKIIINEKKRCGMHTHTHIHTHIYIYIYN